MLKTINVAGVEFEVEFAGTPFVPAKTWGPPENCYPAEGGEPEVEEIYLNGVEVSEFLAEWVLISIDEKVTEYLCTDHNQEALEDAAERRWEERREASLYC